MAQTIACGECSWPLPPELWNREEIVRCPGCHQRIEAVVFPSIEGVRAGAAPEAIAADSEASCFFHPESRAVTPCEECGRFLCALCDLEIDKKHFCPQCFKAGLAGERLENLETRRTMYDSMALALATFPALLVWPTIVSAPWALFLVIRRWNAPLSILPRTRVRYYLAGLLAVVEMAGVFALIWAIARVPRPGL